MRRDDAKKVLRLAAARPHISVRAARATLFVAARRTATRVVSRALVLAVFLLLASASARAATFTVNSTADVNDRNPGDGICRSSNGTGAVCSLRAAIQETNALAGTHTVNFNIAGAGVATITITGSALPAITSAGLTIDATTQPNNNPGSMGAGGTVGVDGLALSTVNKPDVQVVDGGGFAIGLDIQASNVTIRGLCIYGFGTTPNSDTSANVRVGNFTGTLIEQNVLGTTATSFSDPGAARSPGDNIRVVSGDNGTIRNNLIGYSNGKGVQLGTGANGWTVTNNEMRGNGINNSNLDGIDVENGSGSETIVGNLFWDNEALGVDMYQSSGGNLVQNNTITHNGIGAGANVETAGVRVYGTGSSIDRNIINANFGAGVLVTASSTGDHITRNSIYANGTITNKGGGGPSGEIGIDLESATDNESTGTSPFVTTNDSGDPDAGGNTLLNFPVFTAAVISGTNLTLTGFARPGSQIELFVAAADPRGFGEGQTYLVTLTEGSGSDLDAGTGTYTSPLNGLTVGTDTTNRFKFTIATPFGVAAGTVLTATATVGTNTSEFSNNVAVVNAPNIALCKTIQGQPCPPASLADQRPGTDITYVITFTNSGGTPASNFILTDPDPSTTLKINDNADFKVGSVSTTLGGLTSVTVAYSNDGGVTFAYTPASGAGGAPAGYDRNVTHIRWTFTGSLSQTPPNNAGSVSFTTRIR